MRELCINCEHAITGKYCSNCGQKAEIGRLSLHELFHELWHAFTHTDKGIIRLVGDLIVRPRSVYLNYFEGQRKKYFSPVVFFLVAAGLLAYLYPHVFEYQNEVRHTYNTFGEEIAHKGKFRALELLPFQALLTWLFFYKRFNLAETTVFWLFATGLVSAIRLVFLPVYFPLIQYKAELDVFFQYFTLLLFLAHAFLVFGRGSWWNTLAVIVLVNILFVLNEATEVFIVYQLVGNKTWNLIDIHSVWDLIRLTYALY